MFFFISSFNVYFEGTYSVPGTVLGAENIAEDTAVEAMPLFSILTGRDK